MRVFFIVALISLTCFTQAQNKPSDSYKGYFQEGLYLLLEGNYESAQENFESAYRLDSSTANINYLLGVCYINSALNKAKAETYFERALKKISKNYKADNPEEKSASPLAVLYYGKALHINYKFDQAIAQFDQFASKYADTKELKKEVAKERATSVLAKEIVANPLNIKIQNMGDSINSKYPEYAPVLSADERTIIFTTRRPNSTGGLRTLDGQYFEDIVISYKDNAGHWSTPVPIPGKVDTDGHEASINLTPDGQTLIVYRNDAGDGNIYYTTFEGKEWSELKEFGSDVNSKYFESHACLNVDGSILFFTSDRPGGFGGRDIYRCIKLPNGKWSKAFLNVGPAINTEYDEDGAFMHPDATTFFFASKGPKSMGGYDILFATLNEDNKFTDITNIGYPINTTDDDVFYVTSPDGKRGYFTSDKVGGFGEKDIYQVSIPDSREANLALFKGQIIAAPGEQLPENIVIIVKDKATGKIVGTYLPKLANGTFATILPPGQEYNFSYQTQDGEEFFNEDIFVTNEVTYKEIKREVMLEPVKFKGGKPAVKEIILLNVVTLENSRTKTIVGGAKITLEEEGVAPRTYESNSKGKFDGIELKKDKKYTLFAESGDNKSAVSSLNTAGVKSGKIINQILYLKSKPKKVTSKELLLGVIVKNSRTLKIVANANITLTDDSGENYEVTTNEKGEINDIELSPNTKYDIRVTTADGSISEKQTLSTVGVSKKNFTKTLMVDDEGVVTPDYKPLAKRKKITSRQLLLGVIVRNSKTFKIIPNVKITLVDADGEYYDVTTNEKGEIKGIELSPNTKYEITATSNEGTVSKKAVFTTEGVKAKVFNKTLYIDQVVSETTEAAAASASEFETTYKYNVDDFENEDGMWKGFINQLVERSKAGRVSVVVKTGASRVPTTKYSTNENLANSRAVNLEAKIKKSVEGKGGKNENISYSKNGEVGGPEYKGDAVAGREKYEKFQFGKASIK